MMPDLRKAVKAGFLHDFEVGEDGRLKGYEMFVKDKYVFVSTLDSGEMLLEIKDDSVCRVNASIIFNTEINKIIEISKKNITNNFSDTDIMFLPLEKKVLLIKDCEPGVKKKMAKEIKEMGHTLSIYKSGLFTHLSMNIASIKATQSVYDYANNKTTAPEIGHAVVSALTLFRDLPGTHGEGSVFKVLTGASKLKHPLKGTFIETTNLSSGFMKQIITAVKKNLSECEAIKASDVEIKNEYITTKIKDQSLIDSKIALITLKKIEKLDKVERKKLLFKMKDIIAAKINENCDEIAKILAEKNYSMGCLSKLNKNMWGIYIHNPQPKIDWSKYLGIKLKSDEKGSITDVEAGYVEYVVTGKPPAQETKQIFTRCERLTEEIGRVLIDKIDKLTMPELCSEYIPGHTPKTL